MNNSLYQLNKVQFKKEDFRLNINKFEIHRGAIYLISGRITSGKTLLLNLLNNSANYKGYIKYDGVDLSECNSSNFKKEVVCISGMINSWKKSHSFINQFVSNYDTIEKSSKDIKNLVKRLGASKFLDTRVRSLSLSQRRIISLIAGIAADSKVLIIDDLDAYLTNEELKIVKSVLQKKANYHGVTVIASCRYIYNFSKFASVNITLDSGRIVKVRS